MAQGQEQGPLEGADPSGAMASDPDKEEKQPHMCSMRLRTRRDFESSSALPLSHTKPPATWAGKQVNRQMRVKPAQKTSSHIPGEITLPVVLPPKKEIHIQDIKNTRIHICRDGGGSRCCLL